MMTPFHGLDPTGSWDVSTPEGLARSKEWLERHMELFSDGAIWIVPRSGSLIRIYKTERRAILVAQLMPDPALGKVFRALGWTWIVKHAAPGSDT